MRHLSPHLARLVLLCCFIPPLLLACGGASPTATRIAQRSAPASSAAASSAAASVAGSAPGRPPGLSGGPAASAAPAASVAPAASAAPSASAAPGGDGGQGPVDSALLAEQNRLLIKTGTFSLVVRDVDTFFDWLKVTARKYGGDVAHYTNNRTGEVRVADVIIAVPSAKFEDVMEEIRGQEKEKEIVERKADKAEVQDVTEEFVDLESQVRNLQITEQQLRAVLAQATKTEDILVIQREITAVRGQIEKAQGRALYLERRAAMSTIALHLETQPPPPPSPSPSPSPLPSPSPSPSPSPAPAFDLGNTAGGAWSSSLTLLGGVTTVVVGIVVFCWWIFPLALVAWLVFRLVRRPRRVIPPPAPAPGD